MSYKCWFIESVFWTIDSGFGLPTDVMATHVDCTFDFDGKWLLNININLLIIEFLGGFCSTGQHDCETNADCSTTDSITTDFICSCKDGFTHTSQKPDGQMCYDQRLRFLTIRLMKKWVKKRYKISEKTRTYNSFWWLHKWNFRVWRPLFWHSRNIFTSW